MAKSTSLTARFRTELVRLDAGVRHHVLAVPEKYAAAWKAAKIRRLVGTINGHPIKRALHSHADGGSFILVGKSSLSEYDLKRGALATVELSPDPKPDVLEIPEEFTLVLAQDDAARARWETFTVGRQRSLLHYLTSAKQESTRIKRSLEIALKIRTHSLHGDKPRPNVP